MGDETLPKITSGGIKDTAGILAALNGLFGSGKSGGQTNTYSTPDAKSLADSDLILQKIFADMNPDAIDAMVGNIIERARQAFGPTIIGSNAAGVRAYSDTVLDQLKNEAVARSVGEAAGAKLNALNTANKTAADLTAERMKATRQTTTTTNSKTGASDLGKAVSGLTLGAYGMDLLKKLRKPGANSPLSDGELASGGEGFVSDANAFTDSVEGGGITSVEAGAGEVAAASGSSLPLIVPPPSAFSSSDAGAEQLAGPPTGGAAGDALGEQAALGDPTIFGEEAAAVGGGGVAGDLLASRAAEGDTTIFGEEGGAQGIPVGADQTPILDISALDAGLPTAAELGSLSAEAELGLTGAGELSEVATLTGGETAAAGGTAAAAGGGEAVAAGGAEAAGAEAGAGLGAGLAGAGVVAAMILAQPAIGRVGENVAESIFGGGTTGDIHKIWAALGLDENGQVPNRPAPDHLMISTPSGGYFDPAQLGTGPTPAGDELYNSLADNEDFHAALAEAITGGSGANAGNRGSISRA